MVEHRARSRLVYNRWSANRKVVQGLYKTAVNKKEVKPIWLNLLILLVPRPGFEPGTHGFSVQINL